ncbi:MAG TPA: hypothetical protein VHS31_15365 [Tepidisphaeraceae bacterium]|nr:hypothetical protein [Tepidisphaeraceae bacterium]
MVESALNMREIGGSLLRYANDHAGHYPNQLSDLLRYGEDIPSDWFVVEWGSATPASGQTLNERADQMDAGGHCSYAYLAPGRMEKDVPLDSVLMYEDDGVGPSGGINCLFGDGHAEVLTISQAINAIIRTVRESDRLPTTAPSTQNTAQVIRSH